MNGKLLCAGLAAFALLHQDAWLWNDARLLFGFLPAGLAYHALYSLLTAGLWMLAIRYAWPAEPASFTATGEDGGDPEQ
jgi:hypothetical protein